MVFSEKYTKLASNLRTDRPSIVSFQIPEFEDMVKSTSVPYPYTKTWAEAKNDPIIAIHTSGSTGAPKPITYNHAYFGVLDYMSRLPPHNGVEMSSIADFGPQNGVQTPLYCAFPLFHLAGKHGFFFLFYLVNLKCFQSSDLFLVISAALNC